MFILVLHVKHFLGTLGAKAKGWKYITEQPKSNLQRYSLPLKEQKIIQEFFTEHKSNIIVASTQNSIHRSMTRMEVHTELEKLFNKKTNWNHQTEKVANPSLCRQLTYH